MTMITVRLEGDAAGLLRQMEGLRDLDKAGLSETMAQIVRTSTVKRFERQRGPDDKPWQPSQRARAENGVTLTDTTHLRTGIRAKSSADGWAVGTNVEYAATHQYGAPGRTIRAKTSHGLRFRVGGRWITKQAVTVNIPARPFLGLSADDQDEIAATLRDYLERL